MIEQVQREWNALKLKIFKMVSAKKRQGRGPPMKLVKMYLPLGYRNTNKIADEVWKAWQELLDEVEE